MRAFNDLAVPGLGGVWFSKSLLLALLGVSVAQRTQRRTITVANAIEALACMFGYEANGWAADPRMRGSTKMRGRDERAYDVVSRAGFYVTQPMRQQTVQPLRALQLVEGTGERFSAYTVSEDGRALLESAFAGYRPHRTSVGDVLADWVGNPQTNVATAQMRDALSPLVAVPIEGRTHLTEILVAGRNFGAQRRRKAIAWVRTLSEAAPPTLAAAPPQLDADHWRDMETGARFFLMRDAARRVLDRVEVAIENVNSRQLSVRDALTVAEPEATELHQRAAGFRAAHHDPTPGGGARVFAMEWAQSDAPALARLIARDGRGWALRGDVVIPGPAFDGAATRGLREPQSTEDEGAEAEADAAQGFAWPAGLSYRVRNLWLLDRELRSEVTS